MSDMLQLVAWIGNSHCATLRVVLILECCESRRQAEEALAKSVTFTRHENISPTPLGVQCL
jgi:hypothetical protein